MSKAIGLTGIASVRSALGAAAAGVALVAAATHSQPAAASEGGTGHVAPGASATMIDLAPTAGGRFLKGMYLNYDGSYSGRIPTAAGVVADTHAEVNTFAFGGGYTFDTPVLGGAHYSIAAFLPYSFIDIHAEGQLAGGAFNIARTSSVDGFGDLTVVPVMLAWKSGNVQYDALLPIYAPTGSYKKGRLGNPGLNYWTFDPTFGVAYGNPKSGFNALLHAGYAMNTENDTTHYKSGSMLHVDGALQQLFPAGGGYLSVGAEAFYFRQVTGDSGSGATLGDFEGMTWGLGPVLGYVKPLGSDVLVLEAKWLAEVNTKKRLEGDYLWIRAAYRF